MNMATAAFSSHTNVKVTQTKLIIDGKFVDSADGSTFESIDPRTGKAICSIANAGAQDVEIAVVSEHFC
jgi:acyl-CoA reductase-like NAD-dependent aldehyde dehydrogenase